MSITISRFEYSLLLFILAGVFIRHADISSHSWWAIGWIIMNILWGIGALWCAGCQFWWWFRAWRAA